MIKKYLTSPLAKPLWEKSYATCNKNGKIDGKFKTQILFMRIKILWETHSKFILNLPTINLKFQRNQSILHPLTLKMEILIMIIMATSYSTKFSPIRFSRMNILILIIQIKLHLITKLLQTAYSTSVENLNLKSCNCITRLEFLKDEFNLKVITVEPPITSHNSNSHNSK